MNWLYKLIDFGCYRNILIYDNLASDGKLTLQLFYLMNFNQLYNNDNCLTDYYLRYPPNNIDFYFSKDTNIHFINHQEWDKIEKYFSEDTLGIFPWDKRNLIIGTIDISKDCWPEKEDNVVILGCY